MKAIALVVALLMILAALGYAGYAMWILYGWKSALAIMGLYVLARLILSYVEKSED